jgi:hypothetical protein
MEYKFHQVWYLVPGWGHITSANALIAEMLEQNKELVVTIVHHALIGTLSTISFQIALTDCYGS